MSATPAQLVDAPHQVVRIEAVGAGVDAEGERRGHLAGIARGRAHQVAEQRQRHVVDRDVAHVLQGMQRRDAAGAGQSGDQDERTARVAWRWSGARSAGLSGMAEATPIMRPRFASRQGATLQRRRPRTAPASSTGRSMPSRSSRAGSGRRSMRSGGARSTSSATGARATNWSRASFTMPTPRASIRPAMRGRRGGDRRPCPGGRARSGRRPPGGRRPRSGAAPGRTCPRPRARAAARRARLRPRRRERHAGRVHQHGHSQITCGRRRPARGR